MKTDKTLVAPQTKLPAFGPTLQVHLATDQARMPTYAHPGDACFDLYLAEDVHIPSGRMAICLTGLQVGVPEGYGLFIFARSGLATRLGLRPSNCVCVIDHGYQGEIVVPMFNDSGRLAVLRAGDRIAQGSLFEVPRVSFELVAEFAPSARGTGGFGSTGV